MPDTFKGEIEEYQQDWLDHFKTCADINSWNGEMKCKYMGMKLNNTAHKVNLDLKQTVKGD